MRIEVEYPGRTYGTPHGDYLLGIHREAQRLNQPDAIVLAMRCGVRVVTNKGEARSAKIRLSLEEARQLRAALEHVIDGGTDALPRVIADGAASWEVQVEDGPSAGLTLTDSGGYDVINHGTRLIPYVISRVRSMRDGSERRIASFMGLRPGERGYTNLMHQAPWTGLAPTGEVDVMTVPVPPTRRP